LRGTASEIVASLKAGEVEFAIAADLGESWERLDRWPLFTEEFGLMLNAHHPLASRTIIDIDELRQERWLRPTYCEHFDKAAALIRGHKLDVDHGHEIS
jgi:DNA-binding transcriptional LysR family regulator